MLAGGEEWYRPLRQTMKMLGWPRVTTSAADGYSVEMSTPTCPGFGLASTPSNLPERTGGPDFGKWAMTRQSRPHAGSPTTVNTVIMRHDAPTH